MANQVTTDDGCRYKEVRFEPLTEEELEELKKFQSASSKSSSDNTS